MVYEENVRKNNAGYEVLSLEIIAYRAHSRLSVTVTVTVTVIVDNRGYKSFAL
jgi:hypothetical protein